jgi:transcriptional regulator with XRE-family HTH domain
MGIHLEQVLAGIDDGFAAIVRDSSSGAPAAEPTEHDLGEVQALFGRIAATHMRPVRDFLVELRLGAPPKDWIQLCLPAMSSLRRSAEGMSLPELCAALGQFIATLKTIAESQEKSIVGPSRDALMKVHGDLEKLLPDAFALDQESSRREPIIVQSLLRQVEGVRAVALDKIYAAGLTSLEMFYPAKPEDLVAATGLEPALCGRIVERFARHRQETAMLKPDIERSAERAELGQLLDALRQQNEAFRQASSARHGGSKQKRRVRRQRADTLLKINVLLARLGEVDRVEALERLPFEKKVEQLAAALAELSSPGPGSA